MSQRRLPIASFPKPSLPPLDMLTGYRRHQSILSSSPIRSSSPPRTPYLPGYGHYQPYIQSSPLVDANVELPPLRYRADDPPSIWSKSGRTRDNHLPASLKHASIGRTLYFDNDDDLPPSSDFEMGEDPEMALPELASAGGSTPGYDVPSLSFSDSDSEQHVNGDPSSSSNELSEEAGDIAKDPQGEEDGFDYGNGGWRATFFRVSEERGRWKDDPVALKPTTTAGLKRRRLSRQSMPALSSAQASSVGPSSIATRTISEPLASTVTPSLQTACDGSRPGSDLSDLPGAPTVDMERCERQGLEPPTVIVGLAQAEQDPEPSLESHRDSSSNPSTSQHASPGLDGVVGREEEAGHEEDEASCARDQEEDSEQVSGVTENDESGNRFSSPLPPSSPPLSPMSGCILSLSRSVSPLSFLPSSPSSSVRGLDFDQDDCDGEDVAEGEKMVGGDGDAMVDDVDDDRIPRSATPSHTRSPSTFGRSSSPWLSDDFPPRRRTPSREHGTTDATHDDDDVDMQVELPGASLVPSPPVARPNALLSGPAANASTLSGGKLVASISSSSSSQPTSASVVLSSPAAATTTKAKGKHVRRESQGSEKENASVKRKSGGTAAAATKKRKDVIAENVAPEMVESGASRPAKKRKIQDGEDQDTTGKMKVKKAKSGEVKKVQETTNEKLKGKGKEKARQDVDVDMLEDAQTSTKPKQRRKAKVAREDETSTGASSSKSRKDVAPLTSSTSKTTTAGASSAKPKTNPSRKRKGPPTPDVPAEPEPFDEEMTGMLIEVLATSRASSLAMSVLCKSVLQAHPYLKDEPQPSHPGSCDNGGEVQAGCAEAGSRVEDKHGSVDTAAKDEEEGEAGKKAKECPYPYLKNRKSDKSWKGVVQRVLVAGSMEGGGSGVFGKVDSSGKDDSDRPLEAQWFYVPECDEDQDRASLLKSLMPRPAKRSETKKYKQYYWRPLDKISRWDREDDL